MRKIIIILSVLLIFIIAPLFLPDLFADQPPDPGGGPGTGDDPVGGGSPVGGGLIILATLGVAYVAKKVYEFRSKGEIE